MDRQVQPIPKLVYIVRATPADQPELHLVWDDLELIVPVTNAQNRRIAAEASHYEWTRKR